LDSFKHEDPAKKKNEKKGDDHEIS